MTQPPTPDAILQTGLAFWPAKTLLTAIELGVFTELASGAETLEWLRTRLGLHPRSARDFFDTLVALGFLTRQDGRYANTAATDLFLDRRKPSYIGGILEMANARLYRFWGDLTEGLKTGLPQNEIKYGMTGLFENLYADPARLKQFLEAMTGLSRGANLAIARNFPWASTGPTWTSARHRAISPRRSRSPTRTCSARASISRRWNRFSSSMSPASALRSG